MAMTPSPSAALVRTARSEIERVRRGMSTIQQRRAALLAQLEELDAELDAYKRRESLLQELVHVEQAVPTVDAEGSEARRPRRALKGTELRRVAGRLLWNSQGENEVHYREWFERVIAEGYAIGGKDPAASFLTNIRDSPAVVRGSRPGGYRLDPGNSDRLAQEIREAQAELADVERSIEQAYDADRELHTPIQTLREHRRDLKQRLKRLEAKAAELRYVFGAERIDGDAEESAAHPALQAA